MSCRCCGLSTDILKEFSSCLKVPSRKLALRMKTHFARKILGVSATWLVAGVAWNSLAAELTYPIVGTGQKLCYDNFHAIAVPLPGQAFYGQDAQHPGNAHPPTAIMATARCRIWSRA